MLTFDAGVAQLLDTAYQGADLTRRRQASFDALAPLPGETILDIGCGNGLLTRDLARAVGPSGRVIGIDPSPDMRASAETHCAGFPHVVLLDGTAHDLPVPDAEADRAVSVQVFEYVDDLDRAIAETLRALKPGGRLVISDVHFDTLAWFSDDPDRMREMCASWDRHCVHRDAASQISALLKSQGHDVMEVRPFTMSDHVLKPDGIAMMMLHLMQAYAVQNDHLDAERVQDWFDEQVALAKDGRFFFSLTQFVVVARKSP